MKRAISNIAWSEALDGAAYRLMKEYGFTGLEIAPTRVIPEKPYDHAREAGELLKKLQGEYGFVVPSMQSIWYGRTEKIFGSAEEREALIRYTKQAIDFAEAIHCENLVFGCPRNRVLFEGADPEAGISFFREIGSYALVHHTVIGMEANPPIYHTNYINGTSEALALIRAVDCEGFRLNLDTGTMVENGEEVSLLKGSERLIHHVHISEPGLRPLEKRALHRELSDFLRGFSYAGFVSIEAGRQEDAGALENMMSYVAELFG